MIQGSVSVIVRCHRPGHSGDHNDHGDDFGDDHNDDGDLWCLCSEICESEIVSINDDDDDDDDDIGDV